MSDDFIKDDAKVIVECPSCLTDIPTNYWSIGESNELTCRECGFAFVYDVEELKRKANDAMRKIFGTKPKDPKYN